MLTFVKFPDRFLKILCQRGGGNFPTEVVPSLPHPCPLSSRSLVAGEAGGAILTKIMTTTVGSGCFLSAQLLCQMLSANYKFSIICDFLVEIKIFLFQGRKVGFVL